MLDIEFIRDNKDLVRAAIKNKRADEVDLDQLVQFYDQRKEQRTRVDELNRQKNEAAAARDVERGKAIKADLQAAEDALRLIENNLKGDLLLIPNVPMPDVPIGPDESGNVVLRTHGEKPGMDFEPKAHWDQGPELDLFDNERAAKVSGSRFTYIKGDLVLLHFAMMQFALSVLTSEEKLKEVADEAGLEIDTRPFVPVLTPDMVRPEVLNAMGRLDPPEDKFFVESDNVYLVGSAEHTLGPMHMGEVLEERQLPLRYVGYSSCFRREAGSYGKDTRGILRMHQFDKMEMETFTLPEDSRKEQDFLVAIQEYLMAQMGLHYQVVNVCTGDMGFPDQRQIDIETWMPGQDAYRETHSADLIGGFQARRLNIRFKRSGGGKPEYVHMNDATVFSMRPLIAIMEQFQQADGSIKVPEVLQPFMGGRQVIGAKEAK